MRPTWPDGAVVAASGSDIVSAASVPAVDISSRSASANFYFSYYTGQPAIGWTGSQASCTAGTTSAAFKAAVIDRIAFYRAMAGVSSSIGLAADSSTADQQAALMFSRNNQLSHTPLDQLGVLHLHRRAGGRQLEYRPRRLRRRRDRRLYERRRRQQYRRRPPALDALPPNAIVRHRRCAPGQRLLLGQLRSGSGIRMSAARALPRATVRRLASRGIRSLSGRLSALDLFLPRRQLRHCLGHGDPERRRVSRFPSTPRPPTATARTPSSSARTAWATAPPGRIPARTRSIPSASRTSREPVRAPLPTTSLSSILRPPAEARLPLAPLPPLRPAPPVPAPQPARPPPLQAAMRPAISS